MKSHKIDMSKIHLKFKSDNDRSLHAACNIYDGERILSVPKHLLISTDLVKYRSPINREIINLGLDKQLEDNISNVYFTNYFLGEMQKPRYDRDFPEYIDLFPQSMDNFPIFFTDEEIDYLRGS